MFLEIVVTNFQNFHFLARFCPFSEKNGLFTPFFPKMGQNGPENEHFENLSLQSLKTFFSNILTKFGGSSTKTEGEDLFFVIF